MLNNYRLSLIVGMMLLLGACSTTPTVIPMPYHEEFMAVIVAKEYEQERLSRMTLLSVRDSGIQGREYIIQGRPLLPFTRYSELEVGDAMFIRHSILSNAKGEYESESYNILRAFPRQGQALTFNGVGDIVFGQPLADYQGAVSYPYGEMSENGCQYVSMMNYPGMLFMLNDKSIVRADFNDIFFATRGTPFESLFNNELTFEAWQQRYPEINISQHEYQEGYYLSWFNSARDAAIVAEYVQGEIHLIRGGLVPHALYIEGCS